MKAFLDKDFLLGGETARQLYHGTVENLPIIDYHCHINPAEIAEDHRYETITQAWLGGDHYKWRLMRANGVEERYITGDAPDREKFQKYAEVMPKALGNPLYHWSHLELKRYFGCDLTLSGETAGEIYERCNRELDTLTVREMIARSGVEAIVTTDDPVDSLEAHGKIAREGACSARVLPGWRPDKALNIHKEGFVEYLDTLSQASGVAVRDFGSLLEALRQRMDHFHAMGCRVSDHGLDSVPFRPGELGKAPAILAAKLAGKGVDAEDAATFQHALLHQLCREYAKRGWVLQIHYAALRNTNSRLSAVLGPDTGFDAIGAGGDPAAIAGFLDGLDREGSLPKTVLYSLNPNDNAMLCALAGCFQGTEVPGKIQHGSAWWFNDTKAGMEAQLTGLASLSLLGNFIGMLTDSRSFLSYTRHEYFRRILCNLLGSWAEAGEAPGDRSLLGKVAADVSYYNAKRYFGF